MAHVPRESRWETVRLAGSLLLTPFVLTGGLLDDVHISYQTKSSQHEKWPKPLTERQLRRQIQHTSSKEELDNAGRFALLPPELRQQIYEYVLCQRHIDIMHDVRRRRLCFECRPIAQKSSGQKEGNDIESTSQRFNLDSTKCFTALLRTCRLIYFGALPVLYAKNDFGIAKFQDIPALICLSRTVRPESFSSISTLTIRVQNWYRITASEYDVMRDPVFRSPLLSGVPNRFTRLTYPHMKVGSPQATHPWRQLWALVKDRMHGLTVLHVRFVDEEADMVGSGQDAREGQTMAIGVTPHIGADWALPILELQGLQEYSIRRIYRPGFDGKVHSWESWTELEREMRKKLYSNPRP